MSSQITRKIGIIQYFSRLIKNIKFIRIHISIVVSFPHSSFFGKLFRKDSRLPEQLQRAMAAEAEAAREARAKIVRANGRYMKTS